MLYITISGVCCVFYVAIYVTISGMCYVVYVAIYVNISRICCGNGSLCCDICHYK